MSPAPSVVKKAKQLEKELSRVSGQAEMKKIFKRYPTIDLLHYLSTFPEKIKKLERTDSSFNRQAQTKSWQTAFSLIEFLGSRGMTRIEKMAFKKTKKEIGIIVGEEMQKIPRRLRLAVSGAIPSVKPKHSNSSREKSKLFLEMRKYNKKLGLNSRDLTRTLFDYALRGDVRKGRTSDFFGFLSNFTYGYIKSTKKPPGPVLLISEILSLYGGRKYVIEPMKKDLKKARKLVSRAMKLYSSFSEKEIAELRKLDVGIIGWSWAIRNGENRLGRRVSLIHAKIKGQPIMRAGRSAGRWIDRKPDSSFSPIGIEALISPNRRYMDPYTGVVDVFALKDARRRQAGLPSVRKKMNLEDIAYWIPVFGPIVSITKNIQATGEMLEKIRKEIRRLKGESVKIRKFKNELEKEYGKRIPEDYKGNYDAAKKAITKIKKRLEELEDLKTSSVLKSAGFVVLDIGFAALDVHFMVTLAKSSAARAARTTKTDRKMAMRAFRELDGKELKQFFNIAYRKGGLRKVAKEFAGKKITRSVIRSYIKANQRGWARRGAARIASFFKTMVSPASKTRFKAEVVREFAREVYAAADTAAVKELILGMNKLTRAERTVASQMLFDCITSFSKKPQRELLRFVRRKGWKAAISAAGGRTASQRTIGKFLASHVKSYSISKHTAAVRPWLRTLAEIGALHAAMVYIGGYFMVRYKKHKELSIKEAEKIAKMRKYSDTALKNISALVESGAVVDNDPGKAIEKGLSGYPAYK